MSNLNIMRTSCCKFLGDCKAGVSSLVADRLNTVLRTGNIFLDDCFFLKRLSDCCFNRRRKICRICHLGDCSAARAVCRLYDHRKALRLCYLAFSHTFKIRHRNSCLLNALRIAYLFVDCRMQSALFPGSPSFSARYCTVIFARSEPIVATASGFILRHSSRISSISTNAYLIKKIRILCPCCTFSPGKTCVSYPISFAFRIRGF